MTDGRENAPKDKWDKIEILTKFLPAIVVALIAILGNYYLQNKQKADTNLKLYTQLLANKENSENTLRKDMFFEMLKSFLSPEKSGQDGEQTITKIREKLFSLELLSRNFHESLDMKPLFKHVLMEIVRPSIKMRKKDYKLRPVIGLFELINALETIPNEDDLSEQEIKDKLIKSIEEIKQDYYSVDSISIKEKALTESLEYFKQKIKKPGTKVNVESEAFIKNLVAMININELIDEFKKIYNRLNKPDKNVSEEIEKLKNLLCCGNSKVDLKETPGKNDQRIDKPTVILQKEKKIERDLFKIDERLNKNEIHAEDAKILHELLISKLKIQKEINLKNLSLFNRELDRLISIAKRVTRKQREVLEDVSGKLSLRIPLQGDLSERICKEVKPNERIPERGKCPDSDSSEALKTEDLALGVKVDRELFYLDSKGKKDDQSKRYFSIKVRYVYPQWKQVFVQIETSPNKVKHEEWVLAKKDFKKIQKDHQVAFLSQDKEGLKIRLEKLRTKYNIDWATFSTMIENNFEIYFKRFLKNYYGIEESAFWLEYFDFPLVDNSYINSKQRYSVVLEGFNPGWDDEDESVDITLLYYPASYAGLKEKSFYNNQLMNTLMKDGFFSGAEKSSE